MSLLFLFPPSLGAGKAGARGELVAEALTRHLGQAVEVEVASSYEVLAHRTITSDVDLAWTPPSICATAEMAASHILKAVRAGGTSYRAALVCRRAAPLDVASLHGTRAAWVDELSTAGFALPRAFLREYGVDPGRAFQSQRLMGSYHDAAMAVARGDADVCAVFTNGTDEDAVSLALDQLIGASSKDLMPFAFTRESPSDGLVITRRPSEADAKVLFDLLRSDRAGPVPRILLEICDARGFVPALRGDYSLIRRGLTPTPAFG